MQLSIYNDRVELPSPKPARLTVCSHEEDDYAVSSLKALASEIQDEECYGEINFERDGLRVRVYVGNGDPDESYVQVWVDQDALLAALEEEAARQAAVALDRIKAIQSALRGVEDAYYGRTPAPDVAQATQAQTEDK